MPDVRRCLGVCLINAVNGAHDHDHVRDHGHGPMNDSVRRSSFAWLRLPPVRQLALETYECEPNDCWC